MFFYKESLNQLIILFNIYKKNMIYLTFSFNLILIVNFPILLVDKFRKLSILIQFLDRVKIKRNETFDSNKWIPIN